MSVTIKGLDDFRESLERLDNIGGEVHFGDLFTQDFMENYTEFSSFEDFLSASHWTVETTEDFKQIPEDEFDEYVDEHTGFDSWEVMLSAAAREFIIREADRR